MEPLNLVSGTLHSKIEMFWQEVNIKKDKLPPNMLCFDKKCTKIDRLLPQGYHEVHVPATVCCAI